MKYDRHKAWPHPVLRGDAQDNGDYPRAEFEAEIAIKPNHETGEVEVSCDFCLGQPELSKLIEREDAEYVLTVKSPRTHFRDRVSSFSPQVEKVYRDGQLAGAVEACGYVVTTHSIDDFRLDGWNREFGDAAYQLDASAVLAIDHPVIKTLDNTSGRPLESIFELSQEDLGADRKGQWQCALDNDRVILQIRTELFEPLQRMRAAADKDNRSATALVNGLYLPALIHVLHQADAAAHDDGGNEYEGHPWFEALQSILRERGLQGSNSSAGQREGDAQRILQLPLSKLLSAFVEGT